MTPSIIWQRLTRRERWLVGLTGVIVAALLLYTLLWRPLAQRLDTLRLSVGQQREELVWLQQAAQQLQRLQQQNGAADRQRRDTALLSLATLVDRSARTVGLQRRLKQVEPDSNSRVRVRLEQVGFDAMLRWLGVLAREHGIQIISAVVEPQQEIGRVDARLVLQAGSSV